MSSLIKLAFLTPVIHGHSNIHWSIITNLLKEKRPGIERLEIHIIGDEPLGRRLAALPESDHCTVTFHCMGEQDIMRNATTMENIKRPPPSLMKPRSLWAFASALNFLIYKADEYLSHHAQVIRVLEDIDPDLMVIDMIFSNLGTDACMATGQEHVILSPCPSIDLAMLNRENVSYLCRYPM
jgi:hypothetical protein